MARRGAFKASFATPDIKAMVGEIQKDLPNFAESVVDEVSAEVLRTAKTNAYRAEQAYMHDWNKGLYMPYTFSAAGASSAPQRSAM